jgi:polyferredoxin
MRLNIFLPWLRKKKRGETARSSAVPIRGVRAILPSGLFSDPATGHAGWLRKVLKRGGPTWLSSPLRRLIQAAALLVFLWLFFYVCWPYDAVPAAVWRGWVPVQFDLETKTAVVVGDHPATPPIEAGATVYVVDESQPGQERGDGDRFQVVAADGRELALRADDALAAERLEALAFSPGPWSLHEGRPSAWPAHYTENLAAKEHLPAESFLVIDPLVSLSTAIAARAWVWSLTCAAAILLVCVFVPRGFCGYLCPLGTVIDLFDWSVGRRVKRFRVASGGWWVHIKYYLLLATLVAAVFGVLISGYVAALPVVTRGALFVFEPLQVGVARGWHQVPPFHAGHVLSLVLLAIVLGLGLLQPRFWCKYLCPSGAVFSLGSLLRVSQRRVEASCIHCNKCLEICPFDAIKADFTTRTTDCTLCQTCGGVCPTHAIQFVGRWTTAKWKAENDPPTEETSIGRRGFLSLAAGTAAGVLGGAAMTAATKAYGAATHGDPATLPVRPPGSVPERAFLQLCIRCGACFKACPNHVLEPLGFQQGLEGLWTPQVLADRAGCEPSCNACGQVCPTGAIRDLPLDEKRVCRMGLAVVDRETCLPFAGREACQLCVDECQAAGYDAIEFVATGTEVDENGRPVEGTGWLAPVVRPQQCVGCGLCQTRCFQTNVTRDGLLKQSAIVVLAGQGNEDRLRTGSYRALREEEARRRRREQQEALEDSSSDDYLPDFLK